MGSPSDPRPRATRLLLELGRGGMGIVYLALAQGPGGFTKLKVIKRLRAEIADDPAALQMFLEEARIAARLLHPNIVQTNEVVVEGERYSLEMEYLEGQSCDALLRRGAGKVALPLAVWILTQALAGLHYAHDLRDAAGLPLRVVHRDVSPHNVFVTYEGHVKVLDFGIAKAADSQRETTTGVVKGKATYMAPEQAARRPVDRRADVFAVGVMLWEALAGTRLWGAQSDFEIFTNLQREPVRSPQTVNPDAPTELVKTCLRAVATNPADRFSTAADFQASLEEYLEDTGARVGPKPLAHLMSELFDEQRTRTRREIDAQIRGGNAEARTMDVPVLGDPAAAERGSSHGHSRTTSHAGTSNGGTGRALRRGIAGALAVAAVAGLGVVWLGATRAARPQGSSTPVPSASAARGGCTTSRACVDASGGHPAICHADTGSCVPLESAQCKVLAEPGAIDDDRTLWLGSMYPTTGEKSEAGIVSERGVDLGRRDFAQIALGLPSMDPGATARPVGLIACNDADDPWPAARHLVEEIGVPAVVGFGSSQEVVDLATRLFIPRRVMAVATANQSTLITTIPHPPGVPRLVFRTTLSAAFYQVPVALIVPELVEPRLRSAGVVSDAALTRVALVRPGSTAALSQADEIFTHLRFNGKSALDNGTQFEQFVYADLDHAQAVVGQIVAFHPHVVIFIGEGEVVQPILAPIEHAWSAALPYRPTFVAAGSLAGDELFRFIGKDASLRRRFFGVAPPATTMANARMTMRYNEMFAEHITADDSPAAEYDAFYLVAYAALASGKDRPTGTDLAAGVGQLLPPGAPIDVGPTHILQAVDTLRTARRLDLGGIMTRLDYDVQTGDTPGDLWVTCVGMDDKGRASESVDSGVRYDAASGKLVGTLKCP